MSDADQPKVGIVVGTMVHYYTQNVAQHFNGSGQGPYPAVVTQIHGEYVNLKVFPPFKPPYDEASVTKGDLNSEDKPSRWWTWKD
jgi:hypothetical protein